MEKFLAPVLTTGAALILDRATRPLQRRTPKWLRPIWKPAIAGLSAYGVTKGSGAYQYTANRALSSAMKHPHKPKLSPASYLARKNLKKFRTFLDIGSRYKQLQVNPSS